MSAVANLEPLGGPVRSTATGQPPAAAAAEQLLVDLRCSGRFCSIGP